jgi:hypothetical protein
MCPLYLVHPRVIRNVLHFYFSRTCQFYILFTLPLFSVIFLRESVNLDLVTGSAYTESCYMSVIDLVRFF